MELKVFITTVYLLWGLKYIHNFYRYIKKTGIEIFQSSPFCEVGPYYEMNTYKIF